MAIWKEQFAPKTDPAPPADVSPRKDAEFRPEPAASHSTAPARTTSREMRESLISSELTIEGKIEGSGHVRIAGRFKGEVNVQGNLAIEPGAKLTGGVRAHTVVVGGELEGNITDATKVELLETGVLTGDVKAGSLTVAAGSRMRGQVEFGWEEGARQKSGIRMEGGSAA
jgi:cytoskeletal protein CcmA (bactofilin family)